MPTPITSTSRRKTGSRQIAGRAVGFLEGGDPAATRALVLLHAFPVGVRLWESHLDAFPGWRVIAPALPGFDGSELLDRASIDNYALQVLAFLDELRIERAVFAGASMGGHVVFGVLRQAPDRAMAVILADTRSVADDADVRAGRERLLQIVEKQGPPGIAMAMIPKLLGKTTQQRRPEVVARVREMIQSQTADGITAAIKALMFRPDSTPLLWVIRVPALVLVGAEDALTPSEEIERMAAAIPGAAFAQIEGAGHLSSLENPTAFNKTVAVWLTQLP